MKLFPGHTRNARSAPAAKTFALSRRVSWTSRLRHVFYILNLRLDRLAIGDINVTARLGNMSDTRSHSRSRPCPRPPKQD